MSVEEDLEITWITSTFIIGILGLICVVLCWLERPKREKGDTKTRQYYVCATLALLAISLLCRAFWMVFKLKSHKPKYPSTKGLLLSYLSRITVCFQYSSCILMCMQWCILCAQILNWEKRNLLKCQRVLVSLIIIFAGFYLTTAHITYHPTNGNQVIFDRYDDLFVSCFFTISAIALVYFSSHICSAITRWSSINNSIVEGGDSRPMDNSALRHSVRLFRCSLVISTAYLLRAGSWMWSSITNQQAGPYPWFYPLCFYQYPEFMIAVATMCIVGNLDRRCKALFNIMHLHCQNKGSSSLLSPTSESLRASYHSNNEVKVDHKVELSSSSSQDQDSPQASSGTLLIVRD
jgi:hypothetical protein